MSAAAAREKEKTAARADARACVLPLAWCRVSRLYAPRSRDEFKHIPLAWIVIPALDAPLLVFGEFGEPVSWLDSWSGRTLISSLELAEIRADSAQYMRSGEGEKRSKLAKRIRRRWCALVDRASGYAWPDDPQSIVLFAERES